MTISHTLTKIRKFNVIYFSFNFFLIINKIMKYDYIIIGGGSSGCVTANKLINNEARVLILEEGGDYKNPFLKMPAGFIPMLDGSPYHRFHKTIPQEQLNGRQHDIAQGKILGGGSSINGMVYMRGRPSDYDKWYKDIEDKNWSWDFFIKKLH